MTLQDLVYRFKDYIASEKQLSANTIAAYYEDVSQFCEYLTSLDDDIEDVFRKVTAGIESGKLHNIIIRAEGYSVSSADLIRELKEKTGQDVKLVVLSYLQRGGSPTVKDRTIASLMGIHAVDCLLAGRWNRSQRPLINEPPGTAKRNFQDGISFSGKRLALA